ncbi:MAG: hypothetical protein ACLRWP_04680 [Bilophila wadsworthia]
MLKSYQPSTVINFAAESHIDRSIAYPELCVPTSSNLYAFTHRKSLVERIKCQQRSYFLLLS